MNLALLIIIIMRIHKKKEHVPHAPKTLRCVYMGFVRWVLTCGFAKS
jgi:hypothetical protein